jgi:Cu-processing system ATP-binding protein
LDEPTAGLDPIAMIRLKDLLRTEREKGKTILITTHIMPLVEDFADEMLFLLDGHVHFRGKPEQLKSQFNSNSLEEAIAAVLSTSDANKVDHLSQSQT